ncbi:hypothetical protein K439DRAFT_1660757 [Ramaria rubella]|nr:hypothetical protein K439DRAFT_1660757 [Ramaria rubella]
MARSSVRLRADLQQHDPQCDTESTPWMLNDAGENPCQLVEEIMQVCSGSSQVPLGTVPSNLSCPLSQSTCCCSVATYALLSACWVCQGHPSTDVDTGIQPSYADFFQETDCQDPNVPSLFPTGIASQVQELDVPLWAQILPVNMTDHWDFSAAQANGSQPTSPLQSSQIIPVSITTSSSPTNTGPSRSNGSVSANSSSSTSPGTVAGAVVGALVLASLLGVCGWLTWRWRRRRMIRPSQGARIDLTEPEMEHSYSRSLAPSPFPFPYDRVVPRHHPYPQQSFEPSRSDDERTSERERLARRHTAPAPALESSPMDQLERDLASLQGVAAPPLGQDAIAPPLLESGVRAGKEHPYVHKTPRRCATSITTVTISSSGSGNASSRRARRKSGGDSDGAAKGRYFHLPPSAQYLANVARYPENVDPERPWNIRRNDRAL